VSSDADQYTGTAGRQFTRRALLSTGAAALVVGAAGIEVGNLATRSKSAAGPDDPPDVDLMAEHGVLKRVLLIYQAAVRRVDAGMAPPASAIHDGAEVIHDFIESFHEALEEGYVFPRLRNAGKLVGTVDTLLVQHARGRELTQVILAGSTPLAMRSTTTTKSVTGAMAAFVRMYEPHEAREDTVVFPAFRALLSADELDDLASTFAQLQRSQFGPSALIEVVNQVADIERSLGIYDLNEFTPSPVVP
jgi:hemerythrin-like domain-containing protein